MKERFLEISSIRKQIQELFHRLEDKKKGMKESYSTLVTSNDNHFFGLDSFRFQVKLVENEWTFLNDQFVLIDNRLYCDYYKLYNRVYDYYVENLPAGVVKSVFPIYKDLEPTKVYETELVHKLYKDILMLIHKAYDTLEHEHRKRESEKRLTTSGIHIGNYVHNRVFMDTLIKTNIELFEQYLNTYFIYHMTFLVNLKERLGMFLDHLLRRQPVEQGCHLDELDDNFVGVVRDETDPVLVETFHSISIDTKMEPEEKSESPEADAVHEPPEEADEALVEAEAKPESKSESPEESLVMEPEVPVEAETETDSASSVETTGPLEEIDEPNPEPNSELSEEVASEETPETISASLIEAQLETTKESVESTPEPSEEAGSVEEPEAISETPLKKVPLTAEEVLNPIIEHILKGSAEHSQPLTESAKKKKRGRKK